MCVYMASYSFLLSRVYYYCPIRKCHHLYAFFLTTSLSFSTSSRPPTHNGTSNSPKVSMGLSNMMDLMSRSTLFCLATCKRESVREFSIFSLRHIFKEEKKSGKNELLWMNKASEFNFPHVNGIVRTFIQRRLCSGDNRSSLAFTFQSSILSHGSEKRR